MLLARSRTSRYLSLFSESSFELFERFTQFEPFKLEVVVYVFDIDDADEERGRMDRLEFMFMFEPS